MEKLESLAEEIKALLVESEFSSRWTLIVGYHTAGRLILENKVSDLAEFSRLLGKSQRTVYRAVRFAEKYPSLDVLPLGKAISWNHIVTKLLPDKVDEKTFSHTCPSCGFQY